MKAKTQAQAADATTNLLSALPNALTVGQHVEITVQAAGETTTATGTFVGASKGWYVVELDEESAEEQGREKVSVRAAAIRPAEESNDDEEAEDALLDDAEQDSVEEALDEAEEHASKMAEALRKARARYTKDRRPNGAATAHNGDTIAKELRDYEPLEVCALADRCLGLPKGTLEAKYDGLNNGQKRMNAGNRIRGAWKKAEKDGDAETLDRIRYVLGLDEPESTEDLQPVEE